LAVGERGQFQFLAPGGQKIRNSERGQTIEEKAADGSNRGHSFERCSGGEWHLAIQVKSKNKALSLAG
jgi:hypothetical protein